MDTTIGKEFALRVAQRLMTKTDLMYSHRDYCGMGLTWDKNEFIYCRVYDGYPSEIVKAFKNQQAFVDWLAAQDDTSLSGLDEKDAFYKNNQRITHTRLFEFVSSKPNPRRD